MSAAGDRSFSYSAKNVSIILGVHRVSGIAKESFCDITYNSDAFDLEIGADGEGVRSQTSDNSAKVMLRLLPNSPTNKVLTKLMLADRFSQNGITPALITDPSNGTGHTSLGVWVTKPPKKVYAGKAQMLEWTLETDNLEGAYSLTA